MAAQRVWRGLLLVVLGAITACARPHLPSLAVPATPTLPNFSIGLVGAEPGPGSIEGSFTGNAATLAVDAINQSGGILWQGQSYHLALRFGQGQMVDQVRQLVTSTPPIVALLGPDESADALVASALVAQAHIPELTIASGAALTDPTQNPFTADLFRTRPPDTQLARALTAYLLRQSGTHSFALATLDTAYGQEGGAAVLSTMASMQNAPIVRVTLPAGLADASSQAQQISATQANTVICWSTEPEAVALLRALRAQGWHGQFAVGVADSTFIALAGAAGDGVIGATNWTAQSPGSANAQFVAAYTQRYGAPPNAHAAAMYDAVRILAAGLATVGPNHDALVAYLNHLTNFAGVQGTYDAPAAMARLGTRGDLTDQVAIVAVQSGNGSATALPPSSGATTLLAMMP